MEFQTPDSVDQVLVQSPRLQAATAEPPEISNYMDYRKFLADFYIYRRRLTQRDLRPYSYGMFAAAANIKSPHYLKLIIDGRRNLSEDMIAKFARALGFKSEAFGEFRLLVLYGQATDPATRNYWLKELNEFRVERKLRSGEIDPRQWEKLPNWVGWILYALLDQKSVDFDVEKLKQTLRGKASGDEIESALRTLQAMGVAIFDEATKTWSKTNKPVEAPDDIPVALVRKLQSQLMYLGLESLFQDAANEREFGSLTMALTHQEFEDLRFQLRKVRKQVHKDNTIARMNSRGDRVYQLNLQLFPVSDAKKGMLD